MDQASGLRAMQQRNKAVKVIAISGGKGGVGKSSLTLNLAATLANLKKRVLILDADLGLANIDVMVGVRPEHNLSDVIFHNYPLDAVLCEVKPGIFIVPASSGIRSMTQLTSVQHASLVQAFCHLQQPIDFLLIDTAAGISDMVLNFLQAAQEIMLVVCDEPTSITDAYAQIKVLSQQYDLFRFHIVTNMVKNKESGTLLYEKLVQVTHRFLDVSLSSVGHIPFDVCMRKAIRSQEILVEKYPHSPATIAMRDLATQILRWPTPQGLQGKLEFFVESLCYPQASQEQLRE